MTVPNGKVDFVDNETWVNFGPRFWTEAGMNYGANASPRRRFFWADKRPNGGGYHEHYARYGPALSTAYGAKIDHSGYQRWYVSVGGFSGISGHQPGPSSLLQAGLETTTGAADERGKQTGLAWFGTQENAEHSDWGSTSYRYQTSPASISWLTFAQSFTVAIGACSSTATTLSPSASVDINPSGGKLTPEQLRSIAYAVATENGDASPSNIQALETTRGTAVSLTAPGSEISGGDAGDDVFAITATGQFAALFGNRPPDAPPPTGNALSIVVDAYTGEVLDYGISDLVPPLDSIGTVEPL